MSWLSKLVSGNTLKIAAIAAAGYAGKEYMFGSSSGHGYDISTGAYIAPKFAGDNFAASTFNKFNITPFSSTAFGQSTVGQAITSVGSFLNLDKQAGLMEVVGGLSAAQRFEKMPSAGTISATSFNANTDFQAGRIGQIPIGNGGQVGSALNSEAMRAYMAKQVAMMGMPKMMALPTAASVGSSSLTASTSSKRRQYQRMV